MDVISFRLYGNLGDHCYAMAGIKSVCEQTGKKAILYTALDIPAFYYDGAQHETVSMDGKQVMMNDYTFAMLKPLLMQQSWVEDYRQWKGEKVGVDLTILSQVNVNMPYGNIAHWCRYLFPDMASDLSNPWVYAEEITPPEKVIINLTARYRNPIISYWFLKNYDQSRMLFVGTKKEWKDFNSKWELDIKYLDVPDFSWLASHIKSCKFFLGNQSFCFSLSEGLKVPRILEVCPFAPNVIPCGEKAYDFLQQGGLEYYFELLWNQK